MTGPFPIVCRAHSGGRLLAEIYEKNGIQMGITKVDTKDTMSFAVRRNYAIRKTISYSTEYLDSTFVGRTHLQNLMSACMGRYIDKEIDDTTSPWGWKFGETLFTLPVLFDMYPGARAIHLIRDGRDVMLSRIEARFDPDKFHQTFNKLIVTGKKGTPKYQGKVINKSTIESYRTELELLHWKTVIEYGKKLRKYVHQYKEIKYEDLCRYPEKTLVEIFDFINVPLLPETIEWAKTNVSTQRIGKWKKLSQKKINKLIFEAQETLTEHGYT